MSECQPHWRTISELADTNPEAFGAGADLRAQFKYVDLSSVASGRIAWNSAPVVTCLSAPSRARRLLRQGDVLFGTVRPNLQSHGYVNWPGDGMLVGSTGFSVIRSKAGVSNSRYLFHCIMSGGVGAQANRDAVGSSYPALNDSDVRRFKVFAPAISEQSAIARILDTLDTTIRQTEAIIEKLKQVKQGLLHDLLTRGIDANGELRPPQSQAPHLYKESAVGWIPRGWESGPAASWCTRVTVGVVNSATHAYVTAGIPFVRSQNVKPNRIVIDDMLYVTEAFADQQRKSMLRAGDVAIVRTGYPGTAAVVPPELDGSNCFSLVIASPRVGVLSPHFLSHYLNSSLGKAEIGRLQFGSAQHNFNVGEMRLLPMPLPALAEQQAIVAGVEVLESRTRAVISELAKLQVLKSGLMDDLLTGRVRVTALLETAATT